MSAKVKLANVVVAAIVVVSLSGCVVAIGDKELRSSSDEQWRKTQNFNQQQINQFSPGLSVDEVRALLGTPDFVESFEKDGKTVLVLFYRTHHVKSDGVTSKDECTPLVFKHNLLSGWGDKAYQYL
ncbi:DUF3192 domain-containing protein [Arsukibacterium sp.]|uniref:DUF3192 domain-containing protein n=1 Tax=Arsukibacterium sp. TaxID=1977258 RepID=UPI002FDB8AA6